MRYILYRATNLRNGKFYVGRTTDSIVQREYSHWWAANNRHKTEFHRDMAEFGREAFRFEVIALFRSEDELFNAERETIALEKPEYNRKIGASGSHARSAPKASGQRPQDVSLPGEEWRPIEEFDGRYEVSNLGRVACLKTGGRMAVSIGLPPRRRVLKQTRDPKGYFCVFPVHDGNGVTRRVHQLVARAFIGPQLRGVTVRHKDGDQLHNNALNLEYGSMAENMADRGRHGRTARGDDRHGRAKLTADAVRKIRKLRPTCTQRELADMFGVTHQSIAQVLDGRSWSHVK